MRWKISLLLSMDSIRLTERKWAMAERIFRKTTVYIFRLSVSTGITYLYIRWSVRQAYICRGYEACGGEYFMIPFVFYGIYRILGYLYKRLYMCASNTKGVRGDRAMKERDI